MRWIALLVLPVLAACNSGGETEKAATPVLAQQQRVTGSVLFIGDSITQYWDWGAPFSVSPHLSELLPQSINKGRSGYSTEWMLPIFEEAIASKPAVVVIAGGVNDIKQFGELNIDNIASMADRAAQAGARVILCTVPPSYIDTTPSIITSREMNDHFIKVWNDKLKTLAAAYGYVIADYHAAMVNPDGTQKGELFHDQIHPNAYGYRVMWPVLEAAIR